MWIARWLVEATPTVLPAASRRAISRPDVHVLPEPGRALDHEVAPAEREQQGGHLLEVRCLHVAVEGIAAEDALRRRVAARAVEQRAADPLERVLLVAGEVGAARDQRLRQRHLLQARPSLELECQRIAVELDDVPRFLAGRGVDHVLALPQLVLLRREGECVDDRLLHGLVRAGRLEPPDRLGVLDELLGRHLAPVEERPPDRLALAVVVVEQLPREGAGLVAGREESLAQRHALGLFGLDRLRLDRLGQRERPEGVERLLPPLEQPVAQEPRGDAVLAVVGGDLVEDPLVAREHPFLEGDDRGAALPDLRLPLERQERLQLLQPVPRPRDVQAAADDLVEVDEDAAPEQVVELGLARAVLAHQAAQRRDLVGGVVVDVQRRVGGEPLVDEVDEALERVALLVAGGGEDGLEAAVGVEDPPEVLEAALVVPERVALEVEEEVARRGVGEECEARLGAGLEDLSSRPHRSREREAAARPGCGGSRSCRRGCRAGRVRPAPGRAPRGS